MRPPLFWLLIFPVAIPWPAPGADPNGQTELSVRAISYRAIPHERTAYLSLPGSSSTNCYGSTTDSDSACSAHSTGPGRSGTMWNIVNVVGLAAKLPYATFRSMRNGEYRLSVP